MRSYPTRPWVVYDFKGDELINEIPHARHIDVSEVPKPTNKGIFIVHPRPDQIEEVNAQLWKIWELENIGIYVDEGYMIAPPGTRAPAFNSILTQGRSKSIPVIQLSQRPVWMPIFTFTEASFIQTYLLNNTEDVKTVSKYVNGDMTRRLPRYHSYYYDVKGDRLDILPPVPEKQKILDRFDRRMTPTNGRRFT